MTRILRSFALLLVLVSPAAFAQYYAGGYDPDGQPVRWHVMGGVSVPVGSTSDILQTGGHVGVGVSFRQPRSPLALRIDLDYARNNATRQLQNEGSIDSGLQIDGGWADIVSLTANAELRVPLGPAMYGYVIGGVGGYYTRISLTEYGYGYVCSPWWNYCYIAGGDYIVDQHDTTKFGWNAGLGVAFRLGNGMQLFVEGRYNAIQFQQNLSYVPITVGLRF